jgi:hypothetical protein
MPGGSMMGQAGAAAVGDLSVSWVPHPGMASPNATGAPGMSQMTGAVHAPGQGARSMMGQMQHGPGAASVSQMSGQIAAPGMGAHSMLDGSMRAPGQPGYPLGQPGMAGGPGVSQMGSAGMTGMPGMSQMAPTVPGGLAAPQMGAAALPGAPGAAPMGTAGMAVMPGMAQMTPPAPGAALPGMAAGAAGAPGMSMAAPAAAGVQGTSAAPDAAGQSMAAAAPSAAAPASMLAAAAPPAPGAALKAESGPKADANAVAAEKKEAATEAALKAAEAPAKNEDGGESVSEEDKASLWSGAKEDEELVDPDADRPDFGGAGEEAAVAAEDDDDEEADDEDAEADKVKASFKLQRSIDPAYITAGLMVVGVIALGAVLWSQRAQLSKMWPASMPFTKNSAWKRSGWARVCALPSRVRRVCCASAGSRRWW